MAGRLWVFFLALFFSACDQPLRLPYVPPELHHWPRPYRGVGGLRLHVFHTGTVTVPGKFVSRGGSLLATHTLDTLVFVVEHPRHGLVLFGTGLNRKVAENPGRYLGAVLTFLGRPEMEKGQDILSQLNG